MEKVFYKPGRLPVYVRMFRHDAGIGVEVERAGTMLYPNFFGEVTDLPQALTPGVAELTFDLECELLRKEGWSEFDSEGHIDGSGTLAKVAGIALPILIVILTLALSGVK